MTELPGNNLCKIEGVWYWAMPSLLFIPVTKWKYADGLAA